MEWFKNVKPQKTKGVTPEQVIQPLTIEEINKQLEYNILDSLWTSYKTNKKDWEFVSSSRYSTSLDETYRRKDGMVVVMRYFRYLCETSLYCVVVNGQDILSHKHKEMRDYFNKRIKDKVERGRMEFKRRIEENRKQKLLETLEHI